MFAADVTEKDLFTFAWQPCADAHDLPAQIEGTVARQGKALDLWFEDTLRAGLEDRSWLNLAAFQFGGLSVRLPGMARVKAFRLDGSDRS